MKQTYSPSGFPEYVISTSTSFAHDAGDITTITSVKFNGEEVKDKSRRLDAIIASRKGWGPKGEKDDATIKAVAEQWVAYVGKSKYETLQSGWPTSELEKAKIPAEFHADYAFQPFKVEIIDYNAAEDFKKSKTRPKVEKEGPALSITSLRQGDAKVPDVTERVVCVSYWTKNEVGRGPRHGPPFFTVYDHHRYLFKVSDGTFARSYDHLSFEYKN